MGKQQRTQATLHTLACPRSRARARAPCGAPAILNVCPPCRAAAPEVAPSEATCTQSERWTPRTSPRAACTVHPCRPLPRHPPACPRAPSQRPSPPSPSIASRRSMPPLLYALSYKRAPARPPRARSRVSHLPLTPPRRAPPSASFRRQPTPPAATLGHVQASPLTCGPARTPSLPEQSP
jgi:hypothetical protein